MKNTGSVYPTSSPKLYFKIVVGPNCTLLIALVYAIACVIVISIDNNFTRKHS